MMPGMLLLVGLVAVAAGVVVAGLSLAMRARGGSRASAAWFAVGWLALAFVPLAWGIYGGRAAWLVDAVGVYDFAGAIPLHVAAGVAALTIVLLVPEANRHTDTAVRAFWIPVVLVPWVLWLVLMELDLNRYVPAIIANSILLAGASLAATAIVERLRTKRNSVAGVLGGLATGLAAATAAGAFLEPSAALVTGGIAGTIMAALSFRRGRDTVLNVVGVMAATSLTGGVTGLLMIGLLEPSRGLLYTGSPALPMAQVAAVILSAGISALVSAALLLAWRMRTRRAAA